MTKIYDALKRAEQERTDRSAGSNGNGIVNLSRGALKSPALSQKLIAIHEAIEFGLPDKTSRVITFVSARPGEGTSTLVRELAKVVSGELGRRVALIDVTNGRGGHHEHFGVRADAGLESVLAGHGNLESALTRAHNDRLSVACLATKETLPSMVVANSAFNETMTSLRQKFSLILFDAPSLAYSSDALLLTPASDGVILVVEAGKTRWQAAESVRERIVAQGGNVMGVVLNKRRFHIPYSIYKRI